MQMNPHVQIYANNQRIYCFDESASSHFADDELLGTHLFRVGQIIFGVAMKQVLSSDVDSDDEAVHTKARHVLRRLQSGHYDRFFANDVYRCPFCTTRRLSATDLNCVVTHAESVKTSSPKVGASVNRYAYIAKHIALGIHLRNLQQVAIAEGRMPPIKARRRG